MKTLFAGLFISFALLTPPLLQAQQPTDVQLEEAKGLFAKAQEAYNAGNFEQALNFYNAAYALAKKPTILFNIGQCHRKLNHPKEASQSYKQFLQDDPETQYRGEVEYKIAELEDQLGNQRDALNYYQLYLKHRLPTDTNEADAKARIAALEKKIGPITVVDPTSTPIIQDPLKTDDPLKKLAAPLALGATGAVLLIVGPAAFGLSAFNENKRLEGLRDDGVCPGAGNLQECRETSPVTRNAIISDVMSITGIALGVGAFFVYRATNKKQKTEAPKTAALRLVPTTTGGLVTFSLTSKP